MLFYSEFRTYNCVSSTSSRIIGNKPETAAFLEINIHILLTDSVLENKSLKQL